MVQGPGLTLRTINPEVLPAGGSFSLRPGDSNSWILWTKVDEIGYIKSSQTQSCLKPQCC